MYAKVVDKEVVKYPFTQDDLRDLYPQSSLPSVWSKEFCQSEGLVHVVAVGAPEVDKASQTVIEGTPVLVEGNWQQHWEVVDLSPTEAQAVYEQASSEVRSMRNSLLSSCDWTQVADATVDKAIWATYRQSLRNVPDQPGFPFNVVWPTQPSSI